MQFLKSRTGLIGGLVALAMLFSVVVAGVGAVAAEPLTYNLVPAPGSNATGTGSITMNSINASQQIHIDLNGANAGIVFTVSTCANTGTAYACTAGGTFTTDATNGFHGDVLAPATTQIDLVTLASAADPLNGYQAVTGTVPVLPVVAGTTVIAAVVVAPELPLLLAYPSPFMTGSYPVVSGYVGLSSQALAGAVVGADNTLLVMPGSTAGLQYACPAGYTGPVIVITSGMPTAFQTLQAYGASNQIGYCQA